MKFFKEKNAERSFFDWRRPLPWLAAGLAASMILNAYLVLEGQAPASDSDSRLLNPARRLVAKEDLIVNIQSLRESLQALGQEDPKVSVYFEYLPTGANIAVNKEAEFFPASLLKLPVAMAVAKKIESGQWKWSNELVLMDTDKDQSFGDLYKQPVGSTFTIDFLVRKSLVDSDNTAHFILLRNLEPQEYTEAKKHLGLEKFMADHQGRISAKQYAVILRDLYNSSYLSDENSSRLLGYMTESEFDQYLEAGLGPDTVFSHKIGISWPEEVFLDAGIVYAKGRPYILVFMAKTKDEAYARRQAKRVSALAFDYISNFKEDK